MGMGATNVLERIEASIGGLNGVKPEFNNCLDVPNAGVLLALPALLSQGLLNHTEKYFRLNRGYYTLSSIFLLMAFMALSRLKFIENLKSVSPGEWGKLLGLDRVPEARTCRNKIKQLVDDGNPKEWSAEICKDWMMGEPNETGVLYVDGHVRVYYGKQTKLPRHYISRDKLCARATCDYWVNTMEGKPFFYVSKTVDPGLLSVLENEIIPRLENDIPNQPTKDELDADPYLSRFTIITDRAGYSPTFMARMWEKRIAVQTYHKYPGEEWDKKEFKEHSIIMTFGQTINLRLAERGVHIGISKSKKKKRIIWVREIRRLKNNDTQGSIVTTDYKSDLVKSYVAMISRWCQENFFGYMRREYNLDRLMDYELEDISDTTKLINPIYRKLDSEIRKLTSVLNRNKAKFAGITLEGQIDSEKIEKYKQIKGDLLEEINKLQNQINELKVERKKNPKYIHFKDLPDEYKFQQLKSHGKHLIDTIKMIAYRAETAMASIVKEEMTPFDQKNARVFLKMIYTSEGDILVDKQNNILTIRMHHLANNSSDEILRKLCKELTETETVYPGTDYRIVYELL
jgi:hypothetical protein